ncbi:photosynthetic reaction center subunit H [Falsiroseomonas tokyonensis]|uniref:Photosynthetic reaction center subunit H n=1 Tax=Falsiroseomonas tokyonensis TaxID=430521 RepID=A0ABV7BY41_9PROT|nr:photosynthetic reaction center subunit H [Falsiroseomonas tokyonensis]MBU8540563.1 PRC-barrel domain-containing protein [Falsiroseomonas tokyonensis]
MPGAHQFVQMDLAAGLLYAFFAFFFILCLWLHREGKREGYPLISDRPDHPLRVPIEGFPGVPRLKVFKLKHEDHHAASRRERDLTGLVVPADGYPGAPLIPTGDAMRDGVGPAAYAERADVPDLAFDDDLPKIVPLRAAPGFSIGETDPDPRGKPVVTLDGKIAGVVVDLWVDRSEMILRYLEVEATGAARRVLVPMFLATINSAGTVRVISVTAAQLAAAPAIAQPEQITLLEEDKVAAYFGGGHFYATPERSEALL